ncbi:MAG: ketosteroid isomerase-like protein [Cyclobacteriaceae bacterium]|jgi:ketosteroid isomerase-like protein
MNNIATRMIEPMKQTLILFTVLGLLAGGCQNDNSNSSSNSLESDSTFNLNEVSGIIWDKTDRFTEAHLTKDTIFLNGCFTSDARVFPPNSEIVSGIAAISQLNSDWVKYGIYEFKETSSSLYGTKDYLIDEGTYYLTYGEERTVDRGKYINIWKNDRGIWKIYSNIWNSSLSLASSE